jgi:hypothetical protein
MAIPRHQQRDAERAPTAAEVAAPTHDPFDFFQPSDEGIPEPLPAGQMDDPFGDMFGLGPPDSALKADPVPAPFHPEVQVPDFLKASLDQKRVMEGQADGVAPHAPLTSAPKDGAAMGMKQQQQHEQEEELLLSAKATVSAVGVEEKQALDALEEKATAVRALSPGPPAALLSPVPPVLAEQKEMDWRATEGKEEGKEGGEAEEEKLTFSMSSAEPIEPASAAPTGPSTGLLDTAATTPAEDSLAAMLVATDLDPVAAPATMQFSAAPQIPQVAASAPVSAVVDDPFADDLFADLALAPEAAPALAAPALAAEGDPFTDADPFLSLPPFAGEAEEASAPAAARAASK